MAQSIDTLQNWTGGFPGEHEFSELAGLQPNTENPEMGVFLDAAKQLVDNWHGSKFAGLYLYGTPGTGKSHAAIGLGRALHDAGTEVFYRHGPAIQGISNPNTWYGSRFSSDVKYDNNGVFPRSYDGNSKRNPKVALILDDYVPEAQQPLHDAVEAAAQFGGLVIVTSNYTDPFKLVEVSKRQKSEEEVVRGVLLKQVAPEAASELRERQQKAAQNISDSLRSRIAGGFKLIEFTGEDKRIENSFWA